MVGAKLEFRGEGYVLQNSNKRSNQNIGLKLLDVHLSVHEHDKMQ